ncbi:MAG: Gfo/Idh/MocA family oxidoreductase [Bacteroidota bacterium]
MKQNTRYKFALVGCGSIGKRHVAVLDAEADAELVAICDQDEARAQALSELYDGIPYFTDYLGMLKAVEADIISIATPHALHADMAIQAVEHGFHTLVEKPMALDTQDCSRMIAAAEKAGKKLWVVKQNRHNVPVRLAQEALSQGRLGKVFLVKCDILWNRYQGYYDDSPWRGSIEQEGGALFTQASHFIDLLVWWFGAVTTVNGVMGTRNHKIETEDLGSVVLEFENGTMGSLNWTTCVYNKNYEGSITIIGEKGTIKIGGKYLNLIEYWDVEGFPLQEGIEYSDKPNAYGKYQGTSSNHDKVIKSLIARLRREKAVTVDGAEGMKSIDAIEKIYQKLR